jgi:hypothetical protein
MRFKPTAASADLLILAHAQCREWLQMAREMQTTVAKTREAVADSRAAIAKLDDFLLRREASGIALVKIQSGQSIA